MSAASGAFGAKPGFNQSGGGYYLIVSSVVNQFLTLTPGSGSGGAATVGTFAAYTYNSAKDESTILGANRVIKDMGKTVVSAGRTFRKFQAVAAASLSTGGVYGSNATTTSPGYLTGYLELNAGGAAPPAAPGSNVGPALIARYA
jgi:hypothetical protein